MISTQPPSKNVGRRQQERLQSHAFLYFSAPLKFRVATVPSSRHPDEFKVQGLRNLPAIIHGNRVAIDTVEEIVDYIDSQFPGTQGLSIMI